jgi:hypothetical protein
MVTLEDDDPCGDGLNTGNGTTLAFELLDALGSFDVGRTDSPGYISDFSRGTGTLYRFILVARELELSGKRSGLFSLSLGNPLSLAAWSIIEHMVWD